MVNLYEFLGITPTDNIEEIGLAIEKAELQGRDKKMVSACKNYLLNPALKSKHDQKLGLVFQSQKKNGIPGWLKVITGNQRIWKPLVATVALVIAFWLFAPDKNDTKPVLKENVPMIENELPPGMASRIDGLNRRVVSLPVVSTEPGVSYEIIRKQTLPSGDIDVLTKRVGPSGVSYAWREISCKVNMQRYMGTGDSIEEALKYRPDEFMNEPKPGTSALHTMWAACR